MTTAGSILISALAMAGPGLQAAGSAGAPDYVFLPAPREIEYREGTRQTDPPQDRSKVVIDATAVRPEQGYRLVISEQGVEITAHDEAGAFYAGQTLEQIRKQAGPDGGLRCLEINDWPDFPVRGVLLDISRNKVPTMESLREFVDLLASWKINQLQFYTEHTFAYEGHEAVWRGFSPMTGGEIRALDQYCKERHIDLVPNQNSFGHLDRWLRHDEYKHLAEAIEPVQTGWGTIQRFSLCPTDPRSIEFLAGLYDDLLPNFSSRYFNVCCDETIELGKGRSKAACAVKGTGRVYLDFLLEIHREVTKRQKTMMFWGDIITNYPGLVGELPKDVVVLTWGYEADFPFENQLIRFARAGLRFYVCPGTSTWNSIAGRTDNALANLRSAAMSGLKHGATGFLNTEWGDNGHWQPAVAGYLPFAYGASVSWAFEANKEVAIADALDHFVFADEAGVMGRLVYDLGNAYKVCGVPMGNMSAIAALIMAPQIDLATEPLKELTVDNLEQTIRHIDGVLARLPQARMQREDADLIVAELELAADMLRHACRVGIARIKAERGKIGAIPSGIRQALAADLKPILAEHKRLWTIRNREGGLAESAGRLEALLRLYQGE